MATRLFLLTVVLLFGTTYGVSYVYDHLYNQLNTIQFAQTVPQQRSDTPIIATIQLAINRVVKADVANQELVADGVLRVRWNDFRLAFDPWMFSNLDHMVWPNVDKIWTPDIVVFNGLGSEFDTSRETSSVILTHMGNITWDRPVRLRVPCALTGSNVISDTSCVFAFSSWSHRHDILHLVPASNSVDLSQHWTDSRYDVNNVAVTSASRTVDNAQYDVIKYEVIVSG